MAIIVSDTSPVRALNHLNLINLLERLFNEILIPPAVAAELKRPRKAFAAIDVGQIKSIRIQAPNNIAQVRRFLIELDQGESEALALALEIKASAILIDELDGREVARRAGIETIGVLGVLLQGKQAGFIQEVRPSLDRLQNELRFFISSSLRQSVLDKAGE